MRRIFALTVFVVFLPAISHAKAPVDTSVCSIAAHPSKFRNKTVRIRATAINFEGYILMDGQYGKLNVECGRINLNLDSLEQDETTKEFLRLLGTELTSPPQCDREKELNEGMAHILDPNAPAPKLPCSDSYVFGPRYKIVATFTGKLQYSPHARFGHLGQFNMQLDVRTVANLDVTDTQPR
jgi:hypothetical protein